jgi:hypothetical protein
VPGRASKVYNQWQCIEAVNQYPDKQNGSTTIYDEMNRQVIDPILAMVFYAFHLYVIYKQFISQFVINIDGNLFGLCKPRDVGQHN